MKILAFFLFVLLLVLAGCSSAVYNIKAYPEGSLIRQRDIIEYIDVDTSRNEGVTRKVTFFGKADSVSFMAMKRGYREDTVWITKGSPADVIIRLEKIPGVEPSVKDSDAGKDALLLVMPPFVEAVLHKGVGNLDRYEVSADDSEKISALMTNILNDEFISAKDKCRLYGQSLFDASGDAKIPGEVIKYLLSLKPSLIRYYGIPPSVGKYYKRGFNTEVPYVEGNTDSVNQLMVVFHCRTIKPTGGRIAGNLIMGVASGINPGSTVYNPEAFNIDSSSLISAYFFHPETGEVTGMLQKVLPYDLFNEKSQASGANELMKLLDEFRTLNGK
jgi:hypothetical protein